MMDQNYEMALSEVDAILNLNINQQDYEEFAQLHVGYEHGNAAKLVVDRMLELGDN